MYFYFHFGGIFFLSFFCELEEISVFQKLHFRYFFSFLSGFAFQKYCHVVL